MITRSSFAICYLFFNSWFSLFLDYSITEFLEIDFCECKKRRPLRNKINALDLDVALNLCLQTLQFTNN